jgi:Meiotically up-regulated gene 113
MRERILSEIRRIAEANGGQPPGAQVFQNETAIRAHEWRGKLWARWGDALSEAGYIANEFQQKIEPKSVFPEFALAVRKYGREPTIAELEMLKHQDPSFPVFRSVVAQFESKLAMMRSFREWASASEEFKDCLELLPEYPESEPLTAKSTRDGYVYLIKSGANYKIGRGDELEKRVKQIRTALPEASTLEHSILTDDPPGIEAYWHRRFADKRSNGEWFKLSKQDVAAFKKRRYQ